MYVYFDFALVLQRTHQQSITSIYIEEHFVYIIVQTSQQQQLPYMY